MNRIVPLFLLIFLGSILTPAQAAENTGIKSYTSGNYKEAVSLLSSAIKQPQYKNDALTWNYLGLAYVKTSDFKKARKAFEKSVEIEPNNSTYHVNLSYAYLLFRLTDKAQSEAEKAIKLDPKNGSAYYLRGQASLWEDRLDDAQKDADQVITVDPTGPRGYLLSSNILLARLEHALAKAGESASVRDNIGFLKDARDVLKKGVESSKNGPDTKSIQDELESIEAFYTYYSAERPKPNSPPDPSIKPVKILSKPKAPYTDEARYAGVQGRVRLAIFFGANG